MKKIVEKTYYRIAPLEWISGNNIYGKFNTANTPFGKFKIIKDKDNTNPQLYLDDQFLCENVYGMYSALRIEAKIKFQHMMKQYLSKITIKIEITE